MPRGDGVASMVLVLVMMVFFEKVIYRFQDKFPAEQYRDKAIFLLRGNVRLCGSTKDMCLGLV